MSHGTRENYQDVYGEVLDYAKELFRVLSQSGGPFAPIDNINPNDIHTLAHSVTGKEIAMKFFCRCSQASTTCSSNFVLLFVLQCFLSCSMAFGIMEKYQELQLIFSTPIFRYAPPHELDRDRW